MKQKFDVRGMTCAACQSNVEKDVLKVSGVKEVSVSLLTNSMIVDFDEEQSNVDSIIKSVEKGGYHASIVGIKKSNDIDPQLLEYKTMKKRLIVSSIFFIPLLYLSMGTMIGLPLPFMFNGLSNSVTFAFTQFLLTLPIIFINFKFFSIGFLHLFKRTPNMDTLIALGSFAAIFYGVFAIYQMGIGLGTNNLGLVEEYHMNLYFESAGAILTLVTLGKFLEAKSKGKTSESLQKLIHLAPTMAQVKKGDAFEETKVDQIIIDDIILIKPGMKIPVDGIILEGNSTIDEAMITGESLPVEKKVGDLVLTATINKSGSFQFKATKVGEDTSLATIIRLVENASSSKAPIQKLADKISGVFVPIVIGISLITFLGWYLTGNSFSFALSMSITVLVISCPCALGLATPVAIMVGTGKGAEYGTLFKSAQSLETTHLIDTVVLDKTGTITKGIFEITDILPLNDYLEADLLKIAYSLEDGSEHPIGKSIVEYAKTHNISKQKANDFEALSGMGVKASIGNDVYFVGNMGLMTSLSISIEEVKDYEFNLAKLGKTSVYLVKNNTIIGLISLKDGVKEGSVEAIQIMKKMGLEVIMLTGDNQITANAIKEDLNISKVFAQVLPDQKEQVIIDLQSQGKKVAMIGDGINDAIALTRADIGIAIGAGSDIAIESADIVLIKNNLLDAVFALQLSKKTMNNIKMNLFWAFFYNIIGIPIAAGVFYTLAGLRLNPTFGSLAMSLSSVTVVLNALRLKWIKPNKMEEIL